MGVGRVRGLELGLFVLEGKKNKKKNKNIYITLENQSLLVSYSVLALFTWPEVEILVPREHLGKKETPCAQEVSP